MILAIGFFGDELYGLRPDVFIVDQLSACVPFLRWLYPKRQRTLFYCHFPDQLLADRKDGGIKGLMKVLYRIPFDWFEGWSMGASDKIVVNSNFTKSVAGRIFPSLSEQFGVIYPCVGDIDEQDDLKSAQEDALWDGKVRIILSINRFERKKDIGLAIRAYKGLCAQERENTRLVIAGGYDSRVAENVQYHRELEKLAEEHGLVAGTAKTMPTALGIPDNVQVLFLLSIPGAFKTTLLNNASLLIYTPSNEHFGIVPVEAMQHGLPVLAADTGGPLETIVDGQTGWLRDVKDLQEWTDVIRIALQQPASVKQMRQSGPQRVRENFSRQIMAERFDETITIMAENKRSIFIEGQQIFMALGLLAAVIAALIAAIMRQHFGPGGDSRMSEFARARRRHAGSKSPEQLFRAA
jgi:alpha-1,3/alpha-1,6-mannosyltransferase